MKTVFLDANTLYSASLYPRSELASMIASGKANFVTTRYAIAEADRNLAPEQRASLTRLFPALRIVPDAFGPPPVFLPGKDIPILASAALCDADILLTGDHTHFGRCFGQTIGGVKIVRTGDLGLELEHPPGHAPA